MAIKTLYSVLGVEPEASQFEIEDAFIKIRARYPQSKLAVDEGARTQFLVFQQAYETLSNFESRSLYDQRLATAGVRVARPAEARDTLGYSWLSTWNIVVAGAILLIGAGIWFYHAQDEARAKKAIADRALRIVEEEQRRQSEGQAQAEQRRQALFEENQRRREDESARRSRYDAQRSVQQTGSELRRQQLEAEAAQRRAQNDEERKQRAQEAARRQAEQEARQRVAEEKRQLQEICMQKYRRRDC